MAWIARVVAPGVAHHVAQRGVRRMAVFFCEAEHQEHPDILRRFCGEFGLAVWGTA